jgi:hypothetical protein
MKILSGTFAFVALAVIAIVTLPSCYRKKVSNEVRCSDQTYYLEFGTKTTYVDVAKTEFDQALRALPENQYDIKFLPGPGTTPIYPYHPPPHLSIKTDKVTTSELAKNAPAGESAVNDPNATYYVKSNNLAEIKAVLATFTPSPAPSPTPPPP